MMVPSSLRNATRTRIPSFIGVLVLLANSNQHHAAAFTVTSPRARPLRCHHRLGGLDYAPEVRPRRFRAKSSPDAIQQPRRVSVPLMLAPSGIDQWSEVAQASVFVGTFSALGLCTAATTRALESASKAVGLELWRKYVINALPLLLGAFYATSGVAHFAAAGAFADIYPPRGTWGLWYPPGSAEFHVAWTGAVEALGGGGLMVGGVRTLLEIEGEEEEEGETEGGGRGGPSPLLRWLTPLSALVLFLLTVAVTPANIYMYTHGAIMGGGGPLDLSFHYMRFGAQVLLLSLLATLARDSFFFAWGDELD